MKLKKLISDVKRLAYDLRRVFPEGSQAKKELEERIKEISPPLPSNQNETVNPTEDCYE